MKSRAFTSQSIASLAKLLLLFQLMLISQPLHAFVDKKLFVEKNLFQANTETDIVDAAAVAQQKDHHEQNTITLNTAAIQEKIVDSVCIGAAPSHQFRCHSGIWISDDDVTIDDKAFMKISGKVLVKGNLDILGDLEFDTNRGEIYVTQNASVYGSIYLRLAPLTTATTTITVLRASSVLIDPRSSVYVLKDDQMMQKHFAILFEAYDKPSESPCLKAVIMPRSWDCRMWWIIFTIILSAFIILSVVILLAKYCKKVFGSKEGVERGFGKQLLGEYGALED